ncbi:MAG: hypothetical protein JSS10_02510 [Verrucomicrobia bacterium]|nr:hypothetical protein [Verrucomicrobiota bacterium]
MPRNLKNIIQDFYDELGHAYRTKELRSPKLHLHEHATLLANVHFYEGKDEIIKVYSNMSFIIQEQCIEHQYFDHESCCTFYKTRSMIPDITIQAADRVVVKEGRIMSIYSIYDTEAWKNLMGLLQNLDSAHSFFKEH